MVSRFPFRAAPGLFLALSLTVWPATAADLLDESARKTAGDGPSAQVDPTSYRIGPRDVVVVRVFGAVDPQLALIEDRVADDGTIHVPGIGSVDVRDLTEEEVARKVRAVLSEFMQNVSSVEVKVKEYHFRPISVIGAVERRGPLAISGRISLLEALAAAGGLTERHGDVIHVLRHGEDGTTEQLNVSVEDLLVKGDPAADIAIRAADVINVPETLEITVSCIGEVARSGVIVFRSTERVSLLSALARAGGLTDRASHHILVKRRGPAGETLDFEVDYKRIVKGKDADPDLQQDDLVVVTQSLF
ncbi:MAG: polysaccharide biosynthesis/export family protein [Acidobacteriota bacterium]